MPTKDITRSSRSLFRRPPATVMSVASNSAWMMANSVTGSLFGFAYWTIAARMLEPSAVGVAAAYLSAAALAAAVGELGIGITIVRFLLAGDRGKDLLSEGIALASWAAFLVGVCFLAVAPVISSDLSLLRQELRLSALFLATTVLSGVAQVLDNAYVAVQAAYWLWLRNTLYHVVRFGVLALLASKLGTEAVLVSTLAGAALSLMASVFFMAPRAVRGYSIDYGAQFPFPLLRRHSRYALSNHFAQLLQFGPRLMLPIVVVALLGPVAGAHFHVAWMVGAMLMAAPTAVSTSALARAAGGGLRRRQVWVTMWWTLLVQAPVLLAVATLSTRVLGLFGPEYARGGSVLLMLLAISVIPLSVNQFFLALYRLDVSSARVVAQSAVIAAATIALIVWFGSSFGLAGVGTGWLLAQVLGIPASVLLLSTSGQGRAR